MFHLLPYQKKKPSISLEALKSWDHSRVLIYILISKTSSKTLGQKIQVFQPLDFFKTDQKKIQALVNEHHHHHHHHHPMFPYSSLSTKNYQPGVEPKAPPILFSTAPETCFCFKRGNVGENIQENRTIGGRFQTIRKADFSSDR